MDEKNIKFVVQDMYFYSERLILTHLKTKRRTLYLNPQSVPRC